MGLLECFVFLSFRSRYGPEVGSSSNRFDHKGSLLRGKCGWCVRLTTFQPSYAHCLEILGTSTAWSTKSLSRLV
jgi:hypothetical protein